MIVDKVGLFDRVAKAEEVVLELGSGGAKRVQSAITVDILPLKGVDVVGDAFDVLEHLPPNSVVSIHSFHFLEHVELTERMLRAMARVVRIGGYIEIVVPHFSNPYFYSDYTHRSFFGLYSMCYFADSSLFRRKVPPHRRLPGMVLAAAELVFRADRAFPISHVLNKLLGLIVNLSHGAQELYERSFVYFLPCYEVRYVLRKLTDAES